MPPSTVISWPVTYEASREARKATTAATSSGSPRRFMSVSAASWRMHSAISACGR